MAVIRRASSRGFNRREYPNGPVEIDHGHPLANGLIAFWAFGSQSPFTDLCGNAGPLTASSTAALTRSPYGPALAATANDQWCMSAPVSALFKRTDAASLFWFGEALGQATSYGCPIIGVQYDNAAAGPLLYSGYTINASGPLEPTAGWELGTNTGSEGLTVTAQGDALGRVAVIGTFKWPDGTGVLYRNGTATTGTCTGTPAYSSTASIVINGYGGISAGRTLNRNTSVAGIWSRQLTVSEAAWLDAEPYAVLRPIVRRTFLIPSTGVAATSTSYTLARSPTTGTVGTPFTLTATPNGNWPTSGAITLTLSGAAATIASGSGGTLSGTGPYTWTPTAGSSAAATLSVTPSGVGTVTITPTNSYSPALSNPAAVSYTSTAVVSTDGTVAPNDPAIIYSPWNWYVTSSEAVVWNFNGYFSTLFTGSATCKLGFDISQLAGAEAPVILWRIDDQNSWTRASVTTSMTLTIPTMAGTNSNTWHYLEVRVAALYNGGNRFAANAAPRLRFTGLTLDAGATVTAPVKHSANVLIFGDSIVEGAQSRTSVSSAPYSEQNDGNMGWASAMREMLGCEVGASGWGSTGYTVGSTDVPAFTGTWNYLASGIARPMTPEPDLVVINHGTNDNTTDITSACLTVVNAMLAQWPHTRIILLNPIVQPTDPQGRPNPNTYLQAAARTCNDPARVTFLNTLGLYDYTKGSAPPGFHPSESNVSGLVGKNLANLLRPYLAARVNKRWTYS